MVTSFSAKDLGDRPVPPHPAKMNMGPSMQMQFPPFQGVHNYRQGAPTNQIQEAFTPQRRRTNTQGTVSDVADIDDSPLPHVSFSRATPGRPLHGLPVYTLPSSVPPPHRSPSNPTLSSSYLDTPFIPSQHSIITPAPLRQNPRLAPPSTLIAPSKYMMESSPVSGAGLFWKGLMGATPGPPVADMSPIKENDPRSLVDRSIMSSSPPPMDGLGSPSKPARSSQLLPTMQSSGQKNADAKMNGITALANAANGGRHGNFGPSVMMNVKQEAGHDDDDDDGDGGFDLAKGFAPIGGSFASQRSGSLGAARAGS